MGIDSVFSMPGISTRYQVCRKEQSLYFYPRSTMKAALLLAAAAPLAAATPPVIPQTFTSQITTNTSGTAKSIPMGVKTYKQFYDYTNKRLRKDESSGMTKVYRYDKNIMPPISPGPNDPDFASPKGYQFQLSNPDLNCCWLWLVDTSNGKPFYPDRMFKHKFQMVPKTWVLHQSLVELSIGKEALRFPSRRRGIGMSKITMKFCSIIHL